MKWKESHEWVKSKIEERGLDMNDEVKIFELINELDKEYPKNMKKARQYATFLNVKYKISIFLDYFMFIVKFPIYFLAIIIVGFSMIFDLDDTRKKIEDVFVNKPTKKKISSLIDNYENYLNHATAIFYILLLLWLILKK